MMRSGFFLLMSGLMALCLCSAERPWASVPPLNHKGDDILTAPGVQAPPAVLFIPNHGQWDGQTQYKALLPGANADFSPAGLTLRLPGRPEVHLTALNGNPDVQIAAQDPEITQVNLFRGQNLSETHTGLPTYGRLVYQDLYPGIDLLFQERAGQLAYDVVLQPGAAPEQVRFALEGVEMLRLKPDGSMVMRLTDGSELRQRAPVIYQERQGQRVEIAGRFKVFAFEADTDSLVYGFQLAAYDADLPLVIDPTFDYGTSPTLNQPPRLRYSRLVGGADDESVARILTDVAGNMIVVGTTESEVFPAAGGSQVLTPDGGTPSGEDEAEPDPELAGPAGAPADGFIYKLDAQGNLLFVTVLAGDGDDSIRDVAVDAQGNLYVTGATSSFNFATTENALYPVLSGSQNAFLAKLNATGSALSFSTYYGGTSSDAGNAIALDAAGQIFIAGETTSNDLIVRGPLQDTRAGGRDGFIARFSNDGRALKYATYFGGTSTDVIELMDVSSSGDIFFAGNTNSSNFPVKHEIQERGGSQDMFLARIARGGGELVFSTFLGGRGSDTLTGMVRDATGNYLLSGFTQSDDFPTRNPWQAENAGGTDGVLLKIDQSGRFLHFSTYIGGLENDSALAVAVDQLPDTDGVSDLELRYIYTGGQTQSHFIPVQNPYQNYHAGGGDGFLMKFEPCGQQLWFSSYFGGSGQDSITQLATAPLTEAETLQAQANSIIGIQEIFFAGQTASEVGNRDALFPLKPDGQTHAGSLDTFGAFLDQIDNIRTSNEPELVIGCNPEPFAPERACTESDCGGAQVTLRLLDPNDVGISAFSTTLYFDPDELQFQRILWNPELPAETNLQYDNRIPGQLQLDLYQPLYQPAQPVRQPTNFPHLQGLIATLEFAAVQVGTPMDNPPLASKMIRLTQGELTASNHQGQDTPMTGLPGALLVKRRCNNLIGDCDCSGQVQLFEIQSGVDYYTQYLPEEQPFCLKRDYSVMRTTDLQEIINNYNERNIEQDLLEDADAQRRQSSAAVMGGAVVAATSELVFEDVVFNAVESTLSYDLTLETKGQAIAVLAADIFYDPTQVKAQQIQVIPREGTQNANKQLAFAVVRPGWLRVTFYGINATTFPSDPVAHVVMPLVNGVNCSNLVNIYQEPSASTPAAETVPIEANSILSCQPLDDQTDRRSWNWQVTQLYVGIYQYAPDYESMDFWVRQLINNPNWNLPRLARFFYTQPDAQALYAGLNNTQFVTRVYQFLFGRTPQSFELLYWATLLDSGYLSRDNSILTIINVAYANLAMAEDVQQVSNLVDVGLAFAERQRALSIRYTRLSAQEQRELHEKGRVILQGVSADPFTRETAIERIPTLLPTQVSGPPAAR